MLFRSLLAELAHTGLRHVVAAHLSQQNNRPELAQQALAAALGADMQDIAVAGPDGTGDWLVVR